MDVRTAVIPAAGQGTRFLPATKAQPKVMLPVIDVPAIQLVVHEAVGAGLDDVIIVIGRGQRAIRDHFDPDPDLERFLQAKGKERELGLIRDVAGGARIRYVVQEEAGGLGHAVATAAPLVGDQPFAVLLGDDLIHPSVPLLADMLAAADRAGGSVVAAMEVGAREIAMYGCFEPEPTDDPNLVRIISIVEKPDPDEAPSNLAAIGRYVFTPRIFDALARTPVGRGGEIQLTDAINILAHEELAFGYRFDHGRFDVGNPLDHLKATFTLALEREDLGPALREHLRRSLADG
jgi:UTP--glucose-1-phosphate uridylyltransferase